jgi:hypothetical protein
VPGGASVKFEEPQFLSSMDIPVRENKQDHEGPHQKFQVAITLDQANESFLIVATNLVDT